MLQPPPARPPPPSTLADPSLRVSENLWMIAVEARVRCAPSYSNTLSNRGSHQVIQYLTTDYQPMWFQIAQAIQLTKTSAPSA
jgi:hypothetical protein